jgi:hypothetical protein
MTRNYIFILIFALAAMIGCDLPESSAVIDTPIPPSILESSIVPANIDFGKLVITGSTVDVTIIGYVYATDDNGLNDIVSVNYNVISPVGKLFASGILKDNGVLPDVNASDGKYNTYINLKLPKDIIGTYTFQFSTVDRQGFVSNTINLPLKIILSTNNPPSIFNLTSPDTVRVPNTADSVNIIRLTLGVSDPEGLNDIVNVILTSQRPDSSTAGTYYMSDDGGNTILPQFGLTSGDSIANDGVYSILIPIFSSTPRNTYRDFIFTARDQSGAFSNVISKRIFIQ